MPRQTRRRFLSVSGAVLGGIATGTTVSASAATDRYVVSTKGNADLTDIQVVHDLSAVDLAVVRGNEPVVSRAVQQYAPDIELELGEPSFNEAAPSVEETSAVDEPGYLLQWDKQALDVETAHETTAGEGSRVAVIDSGVASGHPDLEVDESLSRNFTGDGLGSANPAGGYHGTHVAGIVGASDNGSGVIGTAPAADIVDCRVFSLDAPASFGDILAAIVYSVEIDADVANLSLGAYPVPRQANGQFYGKVLNSVLTYANKEGTLLVVAAGNDGADLQHDKDVVSLPNEGAQALSVAATGPIGFGWDADDDGELFDLASPPTTPATYTNYGTNAVDIAAPGGNADVDAIGSGVPWFLDLVFNTVSVPIYERNADGEIVGIEDVTHTYSWVAGTSMAAPQVAGAAALLASENPDYNANQLASTLTGAASVPDGAEKAYYGSGFLDIVGAL